MKRLRSSEDLDSHGDRSLSKNLSSNSSLNRSFPSHRSFHYKANNVRKVQVSRYDRVLAVDEDRENLRLKRKRTDEDSESSYRRKGFDWPRDGSGRVGYAGGDRSIHRSDSFCVTRREFPKGFRSDRDRSRREGSVSSWRRFGSGSKDYEDGNRGNKSVLEDKGSLRSPRVLRDVKSPSWSKDWGSEQSWMRSPKEFRDVKSKSKSPTWSKDSGSEQSKSVEVKKVENLQVGSGSSSEMEEGELEPEAEVEVVTENEVPENVGLDGNSKEVEIEHAVDDIGEGDKEKPFIVEEGKCNNGSAAATENVKEEVNKLPMDESGGGGEAEPVVMVDDGSGKKEESPRENKKLEEEVYNITVLEDTVQLKEEDKQDKGIDLEVKAGDIKFESDKKLKMENGASEINMACGMASATQKFMNKGKSVVVVPENLINSVEVGVWIERESTDAVTRREEDIEGLTTRGFELFSSSPVRKLEKAEQSDANKQKGEKLAFETLDLSLSLPNVFLPIGAYDVAHAPRSPSHAIISTFCSNSDGITASMSFSGSQSFFHNPSCSLTQNSLDFEQSVGSCPVFQGVDWLALSQKESKQDLPLYQRTLVNGQALQSHTNGQAVPGQRFRQLEGSSKIPNSLDRQLSFHKHLVGQPRHIDDTRSPSQSVGPHENGSNYSFDKKRIMRGEHGNSLFRNTSKKEHEQLSADKMGLAETIVKIVSEPMHVMVKKLDEIPEQSISSVKEGICDFILNADKHGKLHAIQKALQNRSDISLEMLIKVHRAQLEILVALKTGLTDFLKHDTGISTSDLADIFVNLRCRNLTCRSLLPVDECDCKVCVQKNDFCSACMCLVCSKFDMASNTCKWVGCDVCLHWCHVDCGLRESYIRNGHSATKTKGMTEMQFHCVACDHPSEMFGFVKEVFQNFAKDWTPETFSKELEYVERIFFASKDLRGKRLQEIADEMLARLRNKANFPEVYSHIMAFLTDNDSSKVENTPIPSREEHGKGSSQIAPSSHDNSWLKSIHSGKSLEIERATNIHPSFKKYDQSAKCLMQSDMQKNVQKEPLFDKLDSIVRIKLAEAKMFQARADEARSEAEGMRRIAVAKNEKIEEEHKTLIKKLHLSEAEEMRKQKYEELQALGRAHREYFNMKMRMESDIKDLLLKMEATKRNFVL